VSKSHVEKLEEKLDGLVSLLKTAQETGAQPSLSHESSFSVNMKDSIETPSSNVSLPPSSGYPLPDQVPRWHEGVNHDTNKHFNPSPPGPFPLPRHEMNSNTEETPGIELEMDTLDFGTEDPDQLLAIFRNEMTPNFPFINLTEFPRAADLRRDRSTLYTAIMSVTTRSTPLGKALSEMFLKQLAERMVVKGERNMDLLLACLIYAAWCVLVYNIDLANCNRRRDLLNRGHYITSMLASVETIASDLGMNRPTYRDTTDLFERLIRYFGDIPDFKDAEGTREERRSFLGYFYLCSV